MVGPRRAPCIIWGGMSNRLYRIKLDLPADQMFSPRALDMACEVAARMLHLLLSDLDRVLEDQGAAGDRGDMLRFLLGSQVLAFMASSFNLSPMLEEQDAEAQREEFVGMFRRAWLELHPHAEKAKEQGQGQEGADKRGLN